MSGAESCQRTVLVVEDEPETRLTLCEVLEEAGFQPCGVPEGGAALDHLALAADETCLILLDLMTPVGLNGWEFRARQRAHPRLAGIPVVIVSAVPDLPGEARKLEAAGFLRKPLRLDELLATVERHCGPGASSSS